MFYAIMKTIHQKTLHLIQNGEWDAAHRLVQDYSDPLSCHIHGYLHRIEGDLANALYWYRRAGLDMPDNTPDQELKYLLTQITDMAE